MDIKCPNCGNNLVEIIYGMPTSEIIEKVNNKELYVGDYEESNNSLKYHCYFCNRNYYDNLKEYTSDNAPYPPFLTKDIIEIYKESKKYYRIKQNKG